MKKNWWTTIIILAVIILSIVIILNRGSNVDAETAKCISENSVVYTQYGCHACEIQEAIFGKSYKYLNVIDCLVETEKCIEEEIKVTPTWIINDEQYRGTQSIENLKILTGC